MRRLAWAYNNTLVLMLALLLVLGTRLAFPLTPFSSGVTVPAMRAW